MKIEKVYATVKVNNLPAHIELGYMVVRQVKGELWYYATYDTEEKAKEVAIEIGNGMWFKVW